MDVCLFEHKGTAESLLETVCSIPGIANRHFFPLLGPVEAGKLRHVSKSLSESYYWNACELLVASVLGFPNLNPYLKYRPEKLQRVTKLCVLDQTLHQYDDESEYDWLDFDLEEVYGNPCLEGFPLATMDSIGTFAQLEELTIPGWYPVARYGNTSLVHLQHLQHVTIDGRCSIKALLDGFPKSLCSVKIRSLWCGEGVYDLSEFVHLHTLCVKRVVSSSSSSRTQVLLPACLFRFESVDSLDLDMFQFPQTTGWLAGTFDKGIDCARLPPRLETLVATGWNGEWKRVEHMPPTLARLILEDLDERVTTLDLSQMCFQTMEMPPLYQGTYVLPCTVQCVHVSCTGLSQQMPSLLSLRTIVYPPHLDVKGCSKDWIAAQVRVFQQAPDQFRELRNVPFVPELLQAISCFQTCLESIDYNYEFEHV